MYTLSEPRDDLVRKQPEATQPTRIASKYNPASITHHEGLTRLFTHTCHKETPRTEANKRTRRGINKTKEGNK